MNDQIVTNMAEVSQAAEQKFKDVVNGNVPDTPSSLQEVNKTDTTMPEMGHNQDSVVVKNEFKTSDGVIGEDPTLVTPPYENSTPDTEQEKAVTGVTEKTAAITFDENITNADAQDHEDSLEEAYLKAEEELNKAFEESTEGEPYTPGDSSMDGSSNDNTEYSSDTEESNNTGGDTETPDSPPEDEPSETEEENKSDNDSDTEEVEEHDEEKEDDSDKSEDEDDDEVTPANESDESDTDYVNVSLANPSSIIEEKVDGFVTTDGDKIQELIPPVIEVNLQDEMPAENPTKDIVQEENTDTGSIGAAPGADEIIAELDKLNIIADSINEGSTENIGSSGSGDGDGDPVTPSDDSIPATEDEDVVTEETEEKTDDTEVEENTETSEVNEVSEGGDDTTSGSGDYKEPDTLPKDPQPIQDNQTDVSAGSNDTSGETGSDTTVGEAGDSTPLDSDVDLHGSEFEKAAEEFDNIIKTDDIGDSTVGEVYTEKSDLITGGLQEMAAHAESVRAELKKAGAMLGFEAAMIGINVGGMESATNTNDTFDNSGDLFKDIFKGL